MLTIDAFAFCRHGERQAGTLRLTDLPRLRAECVADEGELEWALAGSMSDQVLSYPALHLVVKGTVQLTCQRCLTAYAFQIQADSTILLAKDEENADQLEASLHESDQGMLEIIVGSKTLDVLALLEDEALLALPLSPRHEVCPNETKLNTQDQKKTSPFSILKEQLSLEKQGKRKK
jgi:uncharacterized protein